MKVDVTVIAEFPRDLPYGMDINEITSEKDVKTQARSAAEQGIKLARKIKERDQLSQPTSSRKQTVFWTWGEEFLDSNCPLGLP